MKKAVSTIVVITFLVVFLAFEPVVEPIDVDVHVIQANVAHRQFTDRSVYGCAYSDCGEGLEGELWVLEDESDEGDGRLLKLTAK